MNGACVGTVVMMKRSAKISWLVLVAAAVLSGLVFAPRAHAQADPSPAVGSAGSVMRIGFADFYDPSGWIPMKVRIQAPAQSGSYLLRVHQRDLDGDRVVYERQISLTAEAGPQDFWTYFKREPDGGDFLPSTDLRVVLADTTGRELSQLTAGPSRPQPIDVGSDGRRPLRLVLLVGSDMQAGSYPGYKEIGGPSGDGGVVGLTEISAPAGITVNDLPDRAIGYDAVSAVVWQDADPDVLLEGGGERMIALRQWVRDGGRLIITHRADWQSLQPIFDMLPVVPHGIDESPDLMPLRGLAQGRGAEAGAPEAYQRANGPFRFVISTPKPEAIVERWLLPDDLSDATRAELGEVLIDGRAPLLARMPYGYGSVTWLATDLSNRNVVGQPNLETRGWTAIWATLLDIGDTPTLNPDESETKRFDVSGTRDLSPGPLSATRLAGKSVALVTLALVFFIAYWLLAGPGLYFYLATRKKTHMSWFLFGAVAAGAAVLTVGLTRLVLRGPPELRHVSIERAAADVPKLVMSDMGLYIPRDGQQRITLEHVDDGVAAPITAFVPPADPINSGGLRTNPISYTVALDQPVIVDEERSEVVVEIPYRSTLKKLEARWHGEAINPISGSPRLVEGSFFPVGSITNSSGRDLRNVHIAYKVDRAGVLRVMVLYLPHWRSGETIAGLDRRFRPEAGEGDRARQVDSRTTPLSGPPRDRDVWGFLDTDWAANYWFQNSDLRQGTLGVPSAQVDDWSQTYRMTPALLSLYSMLPPMTNDSGGQEGATLPIRPGLREWDVSAAVSAGNLVVIGESLDQPIAMPLTVEGLAVEGLGTVIVQYVAPLSRTEVKAAERLRFQDEQAALEEATTNPAQPE